MRTPPSLLLGLLGLHAVAAAVPEPPPAASKSVCESRTVNYITHTLPQQCLRTSWTTPTAVTSAAAATETTSSQTLSNETAAPTQANETQQHQKQQHHDQPKPSAEHTREQTMEEQEDEDLAASTFMSFEEWKEMMLRKAGDPANNNNNKGGGQKQTGQHDQNGPSSETDGHHGPGDDGENPLNFDALSEKVSELTTSPSGNPSTDHGSGKAKKDDQVVYEDGKTQYYRSKDAGKTCKERFSYSSFDAGATVLKTSPGAKNAKAILVENKDSYMLLECRAKSKFVIVELSDDILVDTVVLANFEFFSSMIRRFRVSVSDRYPVKLDKWVELGTFEARNSRDIQAFLVEHPQIYTKYIRIEFLSHYGNEYYCPVSLLRVHGTRMLDTWKEPDDRHDDEQETIEAPPIQEPLPQTPEPEQPSPQVKQPPVVASEPEPSAVTEVKEETHEETEPVQVVEFGFTPWDPVFSRDSSFQTCALRSRTTGHPTRISPGADNDKAKDKASTSSAARETSVPKASSAASKSQDTAKAQPASSDASHTSVQSQTTIPITACNFSQKSPPGARPSTAKSESAPLASSAPKPPNSSGSTTGTTAGRADSKDHNNAGNAGAGSPPNSNKNAQGQPPKPNSGGSPTISSHPASPTVQESFFKTVHKRLTHLESNTSLSLQYIEQQSRFLQDVLSKLERRQLTRVDAFLDTLNKTVLTELRNVRQQYDQIWQSTVIALETQREQTEREVVALSGRLNVLADEVVFQKRMAILQSVLLLSCLMLVIFNRTGGSGGGNSTGAGPGGRPTSRGASWFFDSPVQSAVQGRRSNMRSGGGGGGGGGGGSGWISNMSMSMGMTSPFPFSTFRESSSSGLQQEQPTTTTVAAVPETSQSGGGDTDAAALRAGSGGVDVDTTIASHQQLHPNGAHQHHQLFQTQQQQQPYAYPRNDKALPLTPTSEFDSREGTPLIHTSPLRQTSTSIDEVLAEEGGGDGGSPLYTQSSMEPGPQVDCGPDQEELSQSSSSGSESGGFTQSEVFRESAQPVYNGDTTRPGQFDPVEEGSERAGGDDIGPSLVNSIEDEQQQMLRHQTRSSLTQEHLGSGTVKPLPALPESSSS
ncbi:UNC-like C-terminal-domain-containing protein [Sordaria brevicollis]|uniref:UNC-like C-terminal-domain-containing protein n=1 Tax=Sordaria brevicollis TaxID=83679 RepID=A0AAE0P1I0_SORBR|nr:UNC-like C-terminal-domain-containing protein [Sordaria brevicollis]